jgi:nitroreductase
MWHLYCDHPFSLELRPHRGIIDWKQNREAREVVPLDAIDALKTRRSIRRYEEKPVPRELIEQIIDTARLAPSGRNTQPWEFIVITEATTRKRIAELAPHGKFIAQAGACVAVFAREGDFCLEDGSAATENILVSAHALGLGTCWVASFKKPHSEPVAELLGVPAGLLLISMISLGYPAEKAEPHGKRDLADVLHWERF